MRNALLLSLMFLLVLSCGEDDTSMSTNDSENLLTITVDDRTINTSQSLFIWATNSSNDTSSVLEISGTTTDLELEKPEIFEDTLINLHILRLGSLRPSLISYFNVSTSKFATTINDPIDGTGPQVTFTDIPEHTYASYPLDGRNSFIPPWQEYLYVKNGKDGSFLLLDEIAIDDSKSPDSIVSLSNMRDDMTLIEIEAPENISRLLVMGLQNNFELFEGWATLFRISNFEEFSNKVDFHVPNNTPYESFRAFLGMDQRINGREQSWKFYDDHNSIPNSAEIEILNGEMSFSYSSLSDFEFEATGDYLRFFGSLSFESFFWSFNTDEPSDLVFPTMPSTALEAFISSVDSFTGFEFEELNNVTYSIRNTNEYSTYDQWAIDILDGGIDLDVEYGLFKREDFR